MSPALSVHQHEELAPGRGRRQQVTRALEQLHTGRPIVIGHRDHCAVAVLAGAASTESIAFLVREGSGLVTVAMPRARLDTLEIPRIGADPGSRSANAHVAVDAATGVGTGISAADRAETIRRLADPRSRPSTFTRPGHVILVAADLVPHTPPGMPEVALMLGASSAAPTPAVAFCALTSPVDPCTIADATGGADFAARTGLAYVSGQEIIRDFYCELPAAI
ncbi:3,4-dihydroxy-2-butanone-4-phosphate synthase [Rhodococcus opacus]|uniref:3,4-dihydroxy-2-butanone-4-phosphate synthase n=2 Tax=Rhodococcus opacus TaxID=37919 RepID=UPI00042E225A|nr:3,4-dihydroxy-2-butanone-4-phosphate synthase [Rhodococcus opacus]AHK35249.1 Riboflavin biosynthesis protein ribBA [Rhodococcus opacus PD630]UDH01586.1 3,4-dihydroxy-2-butanone-4-phosphate synthase [Rhodococcus opacus PD630]